MKIYDIVLLTDARYVNPKVVTPYVENILKEDSLVIKALEDKGIKVVRADWADVYFDWSSTKFALFRTTWDYYDRYDEFLTWLQETKEVLHFINPIEMVLWNIDKHYLQDLAGRGVNIPESKFIEVGEKATLSDILSSSGWQDAILKPAISASARHTYRINTENSSEIEPTFQSLIKSEAMLVQPFQKSVLERGEIALMYFNGKYSHAVLKVAKKGDFRVQDDFGGAVHDYVPTPDEITLGEQTLKACATMPVYARVDIIEDNNGNPAVIELEIIEPELWFRHRPAASESFAEAIVSYLNNL